MRRSDMSSAVRPLLLLIALMLLGGSAWAQKTKLTVYTAIENEQLEPFKKAFEADNPTIEIAWVRDSTGVMTAKLVAEKDNPRADVIWGLAASSIGLMAGMGMSFLSLRTVRHELASGHIALVDIEGLPVMGHWYVTHLSSKKLSPAALAFKEFLIEQGGALMDTWS